MSIQQQGILSEDITAEVIKRWKTQHPQGVFLIEVSGLSVYVRMPTDKEMVNFCTASKNSDPRKLGRKFLTAIWLGGDRQILINNKLFDQTESQLVELIKAKETQMLR